MAKGKMPPAFLKAKAGKGKSTKGGKAPPFGKAAKSAPDGDADDVMPTKASTRAGRKAKVAGMRL